MKPTLVRFVAAVSLLAGSVAAEAQQAARVYRIGYVSPFTPGPSLEALRQRLRELGYVEGKNLVIEARFAEGRAERLPGLYADLLRLKVDVLLAASTPGALAAKKASTNVPIVFGGLLSYEVSLVLQFRRAAVYVDKILKGAKPADLPVEQAAKFELAVNLATAKGLGLAIPQVLRIRADAVIE